MSQAAKRLGIPSKYVIIKDGESHVGKSGSEVIRVTDNVISFKRKGVIHHVEVKKTSKNSREGSKGGTGKTGRVGNEI